MSDHLEFISCDWGTSTFRLRRVSNAGRLVSGEVLESVGVRALYEEAQGKGAVTEVERGLIFARFLRERLNRLAGGQGGARRRIPLVISGMASSSVGWRELPYAPAPFRLDGRGLRHAEVDWDPPEGISATYLISGVAHPADVMRGEETEIIGIMAADEMAKARDDCILVLPGTHSKHVHIRGGVVVNFQTFMTGELFDVLGRHSLLRASVQLSPVDRTCAVSEMSAGDRAAFVAGVEHARQRGLAGGLFRVRTRTVLDRKPLSENSGFLSGLLIGSELLQLEVATRPVFIAATEVLAESYGIALGQLRGAREGWQRVSLETMARATVRGHAIFLNNVIHSSAP